MLDTSIKGKKVMKEKTLCFSQHKNITPSGQDGAVIRFPFTMVDSGLIGSPEESKKTTSHRLEVTISNSVRGRRRGRPCTARQRDDDQEPLHTDASLTGRYTQSTEAL